MKRILYLIALIPCVSFGASRHLNNKIILNTTDQTTAYLSLDATSATVHVPLAASTISASGVTTTNFVGSVSTSTVFTTPRSDTTIQYGINETKSGLRIDLADRPQLLSRDVLGFSVNSISQMTAGESGTGNACYPNWTFTQDAGTGLYLHQQDVLGFAAGCSTAAKMGQIQYADYQNDVPFSIYGGSVTTGAKTNARVDMVIYTSTATTTANKIAQIDQSFGVVWIAGRDTASSKAFLDQVSFGYFSSAPVYMSSSTAYGSPDPRVYGKSGSGGLTLRMQTGDYLIQTFSLQITGK